jgi:hypothetical protein
VSIYRPHLKATDTNTFLSILETKAAATLETAHEASNPQMKGSGAYIGHQINSKAKSITYNGTFNNVVISPSPVSPSTTVVVVTGTINNYFNHAGCSVRFKAVYAPEP